MGASIGVVQPTGKSTQRRAVVKRMAQIFGQLIVLGAVLFLSGGSLSWVWAWAYVGLMLVALIGVMVILLPGHTEVIAERSEMGKDTKSWDFKLTLLMLAPNLGLYVVAGLDERFGWTVAWPIAARIIGAVIFLVAYALAGWAMAANRFFATTVRIQKDRGHTVITDGPYRFVRHPGYVSFITTNVALSLLLGSAWSLIPAAVAGALIVARTALEDRTLQEELPGYAEYAQKIRFRLIPGVW